MLFRSCGVESGHDAFVSSQGTHVVFTVEPPPGPTLTSTTRSSFPQPSTMTGPGAGFGSRVVVVVMSGSPIPLPFQWFVQTNHCFTAVVPGVDSVQ